jgi:hypothetical protein
VVDAGTTQLEPQIVAFLAPDDDDRQMEAKIAQTVENLVDKKWKKVKSSWPLKGLMIIRQLLVLVLKKSLLLGIS